MSIEFNTVSASSRASQVFIELQAQRRSVSGSNLPPKVLIVGQYLQSLAAGITDYEPVQLTTSDEVGSMFGFGSEIHRQSLWIFSLLGGFSSGVWIAPVPEPAGAVAAEGTVTFATNSTSSGSFFISIGGDVIEVTVASGATPTTVGDALVTAITADQDLQVSAANVAGVVTLTHKNPGVNGNEVRIVSNPSGTSQSSQNPSGMTIAISGTDGYLASGAGNVDTHDVFFNSDESEKLGSRFYTQITCPYSDSTNLGYYKDSFDARVAPGVKRFFNSYVGYVTDTYTEYLSIPATINSEGISPVWDPRSYSPSFELAAAATGVTMWSTTFDPGRPFKTLSVGIPFEPDTGDLSYAAYDALFIAGGGYFKTATGEMKVGDFATSYRTNDAGSSTESWFDSVSTSRRQQKVYDLENLFNSDPYVRGIVADDTTISSKSYVIKPKKVIADISALVDFWNTEGWTKNAAEVKASITAEINSSNNSRIDASVTDDEALALRIVGVAYQYLF